jgi:hypothetical protein
VGPEHRSRQRHGSPGTAAQPWLTIQKALDTLTAAQRAWVHNGTYAENLQIDRAGSPVAPITVEAAPGNHPVVDAAGSHPLEVGSSGAYFRFRGFVIQDAPGNSGGNVDVYGHHVEISKNEITRRHPPVARDLPAGRRPPRGEQRDP